MNRTVKSPFLWNVTVILDEKNEIMHIELNPLDNEEVP